MRVLVMGGTRFVGVETVETLLRDGHDVTVFHRGSRHPAWSAPVREVRAAVRPGRTAGSLAGTEGRIGG